MNSPVWPNRSASTDGQLVDHFREAGRVGIRLGLDERVDSGAEGARDCGRAEHARAPAGAARHMQLVVVGRHLEIKEDGADEPRSWHQGRAVERHILAAPARRTDRRETCRSRPAAEARPSARTPPRRSLRTLPSRPGASVTPKQRYPPKVRAKAHRPFNCRVLGFE